MIGIPGGIIEKLIPFIGVKGDRAKSMLQRQPLILSEQELNVLNERVKNHWLKLMDKAPAEAKQNKEVIYQFNLENWFTLFLSFFYENKKVSTSQKYAQSRQVPRSFRSDIRLSGETPRKICTLIIVFIFIFH